MGPENAHCRGAPNTSRPYSKNAPVPAVRIWRSVTTNNLAKRNWTHDPICKLCRVDSETLTHMCKDCTFSKQVWSYLKQWLDLAVLDWVGMNGSLHSYWRKCHAKFERRQRKRIDGIMIYFWWNVWKEHNRRTFQQKSLQPRHAVLLCKDDIQLFQLATKPIVSEE